MRIRSVMRLLAASTLVFALSACSSDSGGSTGTGDSNEVTIGAAMAPSSMDPIHATSGADMFFLRPIYDRVLETDESGDVVEGLATEWGYVDGLKTFRFTLRDGVTFSDGNPVDAEAVAKSLERSLAETKQGVRLPVESVSAIGDLEVEIKLTRDDAWVADTLTSYPGLVVSPATFESTNDVTGNPIGSGPYVMKTYTPGSEIVLERNPDYWNDDRGFYEKAVIKFFKTPVSVNQALQTGSIQVGMRTFATDVNTLEADDNLVTQVDPSLAVMMIHFNAARPGLKDPRVRQAINFALDRETLAKTGTDGHGEASSLIMPADSPFSSDELQAYWAYDLDKAKSLMAEAGVDNVKLDCITYTGGGWETTTPFAIEQLKEIGVDINLEVTDLPDAVSRYWVGGDPGKEANAPDCFFSASPGQPTPRETFAGYLGTTIYNLGQIESVPFEWLEELGTVADPQERIDLVHEIQREAQNNPLYAGTYTRPFAFTRVKDIQPLKRNLVDVDIDIAALKPVE